MGDDVEKQMTVDEILNKLSPEEAEVIRAYIEDERDEAAEEARWQSHLKKLQDRENNARARIWEGLDIDDPRCEDIADQRAQEYIDAQNDRLRYEDPEGYAEQRAMGLL